jgi:RNA polymerase sigma-70 factor (ECF subfamily)
MNELLKNAIAGNKAAEEEIFHRLSARFGLFARQRMGDCEAAADVAQEACVTVLEKYKTETFTSGFEAWAYGVLRRKIRNYFSRLPRREVAVSPETFESLSGSGGTTPVDSELEQDLVRCLRRMLNVNSRYARILNLTYQGYKAEEISRRLGVSRNNLYVMLNRARSLLKACLQMGKV